MPAKYQSWSCGLSTILYCSLLVVETVDNCTLALGVAGNRYTRYSGSITKHDSWSHYRGVSAPPWVRRRGTPPPPIYRRPLYDSRVAKSAGKLDIIRRPFRRRSARKHAFMRTLCVCVCVAVCARVCAYLRACVRACTCARVPARVRACVRACGRACARACARTCVRACVRACACLFTHVSFVLLMIFDRLCMYDRLVISTALDQVAFDCMCWTKVNQLNCNQQRHRQNRETLAKSE